MAYNPYKQFLDLLPQTPLQVGEVIAYDNGVATIEIPIVGTGVTTTARGDASIGLRVFFKDGAIQGVAPDLTFESIELP